MMPLIRRAIFIAALIATFVAATAPPFAAPTLGQSDKINHIVAFIVLSALAAWAWPNARLAVITAGMAAIGGAIELVQSIPSLHRDADWGDWRADVAATVVTLALVAALRGLQSARSVAKTGNDIV